VTQYKGKSDVRSNNISANRKRQDPNAMKHKERLEEWHELVVTVSSHMFSEMSTATTIVVISYHTNIPTDFMSCCSGWRPNS
jgi:hypothetical protein